MIKAEIYDCNNISYANIQLMPNRLNIRYAMNGTGKSTIARAIELISKNENLSALKYLIVILMQKATCPRLRSKFCYFNEEFVNTFVLKKVR